VLLSVHVTSVLFLVRFNYFALTMGFYWSYTLLLKSPVLVRSWCTVNQAIKSFTIKIPVANPSASDRCAFTHEGICDVGESREH